MLVPVLLYSLWRVNHHPHNYHHHHHHLFFCFSTPLFESCWIKRSIFNLLSILFYNMVQGKQQKYSKRITDPATRRRFSTDIRWFVKLDFSCTQIFFLCLCLLQELYWANLCTDRSKDYCGHDTSQVSVTYKQFLTRWNREMACQMKPVHAVDLDFEAR